jgi:predicted AlkP superfamily phosphohydrolase/phosphomutase
MQKPRVLVIGLDGATPGIIMKLKGEGKLPYMSKILREGVYGKVKTVLPNDSPPIWTSFMTGKNPGKHGIFSFEKRIPGSYEVGVSCSSDILCDTLLDILSNIGKKVCAVNVPMTYPPWKVNGVLVSGIISPMETLKNNFAYPSSITRSLLESGYKVEPDPLIYDGNEDAYIDEVFAVMKKRAEVALSLFESDSWDFFMTVFIEADRLQHFFWVDWDKTHPMHDRKREERYGDVIIKCYEQLDSIIGKFLEKVDENTTTIIVSDHGFLPVYRKVNLNSWLINHGLLKMRLKPWSVARSKLSRGRTYSFLMRLHFFGKLKKIAAESQRSEIDIGKTRVFVNGGSLLYINLKGREPNGLVEPDEYEKLRTSIIRGLKSINDPVGLRPVFDNIFRKEEIYSASNLDLAPDLIGKLKEGYRYSQVIGPDFPVVSKEDWRHSYHDYESFFMAYGGSLHGKGTINANIVDLAPTILHLLDAPIPDDMDGKVLESLANLPRTRVTILESSKGKEKSEKQKRLSKNEEEEMRERLRALGYI